nr:uncharacterized protein LOC127348799 isoform X2 [Lolium perenne]
MWEAVALTLAGAAGNSIGNQERRRPSTPFLSPPLNVSTKPFNHAVAAALLAAGAHVHPSAALRPTPQPRRARTTRCRSRPSSSRRCPPDPPPPPTGVPSRPRIVLNDQPAACYLDLLLVRLCKIYTGPGLLLQQGSALHLPASGQHHPKVLLKNWLHMYKKQRRAVYAN